MGHPNGAVSCVLDPDHPEGPSLEDPRTRARGPQAAAEPGCAEPAEGAPDERVLGYAHAYDHAL